MSKIQEYLNKIKNAVYGIEVRDAIYNSIEQCYTDVSSAKTLATDATNAANTAALTATQKANLAQQKADVANTAATQATSAAGQATSAAQAANDAAGKATAATTKATDATSKCETQAGAAESAASRANNAADAAEQIVEQGSKLETTLGDLVPRGETVAGSLTTLTESASGLQNDLQSATEAAGQAQSSLNEKLGEAETALKHFQANIQGVTVSAEKVEAGGEPTATVTNDGHLHITFGLVTGDKGKDADPEKITEAVQAEFADLATGNTEKAGLAKLYSETGEAEDGAMTQKAVTEELAKKADKSELANVKITLDDEVTAESENAVKSSGIHAALEEKADASAVTALEGKLEGKADKTELAKKADASALTEGLAGKADKSALSGYVPTTRTVAGKALSADVTLASLTAGSKTYNGSAEVALTAADVGAVASSQLMVGYDTGNSYVRALPSPVGTNHVNWIDFAVLAEGNHRPWINVKDSDGNAYQHFLYTTLNKPTAADVGAAANTNPTVTGKITVTRKDNQLAFIDIEDTDGNILRMQSDSTNKNVWVGHYNKSATKWVGILWANHTDGEGEAYFNGTAKRTEQITASTSAPQSLANGAICLVYE